MLGSGSRSVLLVLICATVTFACTNSAVVEGETGESGSEGGSGGPEPFGFSDFCTGAPAVGSGRWADVMSEFADDFGDLCGFAGPDAFLRIVAPDRADVLLNAVASDFVPIVSVLGGACTNAEIVCGRGLPLVIYDVNAGTELYVGVGISDDDPGLETDSSLGVAVNVSFRPVLDEGDACEPIVLGRCVSGTVCTPDEDAVPRCTAVPGGTCTTAISIDVSGPGAMEVDPSQLLADTHAHSCTGARRPELVYRLTLSLPLQQGEQLEITSETPGIGLAVRAPGCLSSQEVACAVPGPGQASVLLEDASLFAADGVEPFLFVELPPDAILDPFALELSVVDG